MGLCYELQFTPNLSMDWDFNDHVESEMEDFLSLPIIATLEPSL